MNLSQQVTNLEISQKLKTFGVKQESLFWHCRWLESGDDIILSQEHLSYGQTVPIASAFTCSELGEMLPEIIDDEEDKTEHQLYFYKRMKAYFVAYRFEDEDGTWSTTYVEQANTLADAMGKMLCYLYENGLIKNV